MSTKWLAVSWSAEHCTVCTLQCVHREVNLLTLQPHTGVSQTAALNRGRHVYSAGRPSRWALAHISSMLYCTVLITTIWRMKFIIAIFEFSSLIGWSDSSDIPGADSTAGGHASAQLTTWRSLTLNTQLLQIHHERNFTDGRINISSQHRHKQHNRTHHTSPAMLLPDELFWVYVLSTKGHLARYGQAWRHPQNRKCMTYASVVRVGSSHVHG